MQRTALTALASILLLSAAPALADNGADKAGAPAASNDKKDSQDDKIDAATARPPIEETASATSHSINVRGSSLNYKATAGTLTIRDDDGKPTASVFYVAYTQDGAKGGATHRPVTFLYNGGPGSSSIWLHMGSIGPMRMRTASPTATGPAPYTFAPNDDTLLDKTDLVFIDAIGTGYSRPLGKTEGKAFWGVDQDADAFAKAITRYISLNGRGNSPKFLFGESYGTTRSAALAYLLHQRGVDLNGVILLSSWLNTVVEDPGFDLNYVEYLPTYAATAWYHNKLANKPADLPAYLAEVRAFAQGPYAEALFKGQDISPTEFDAIAQKLSAYTGLSVDYVKRAKLRVNLDRFRKELLRDQGRIIGRYDSRFLGSDEDTAGEAPGYDPSDTGIAGAFIAAAGDYITNELKYKTNMEYRPEYYKVGETWDFHHAIINGGGQKSNEAAVALDLAQTLRENPHMKVLSLNGWYDLATPFFETEYDLNHMLLDPAARTNLSFAYYPSGHMVYLNPDALKSLRVDVSHFIDTAAPQ
ncbi:MAG: peptidase S10 [Caulobacteraceae bacterium]|nr:peptidase S10 [Caulobacteraceae bacterium]